MIFFMLHKLKKDMVPPKVGLTKMKIGHICTKKP